MPFKHAAQRSADHLSLVIDARPKPFVGETATYADISVLLKNITDSGYFDKAAQPPVEEIVEPVTEEQPAPVQPSESNVDDEQLQLDPIAIENDAHQTAAVTAIVEPLDFQEAPAAAAVPVPTFPPQQTMQAIQTQMVSQMPMVSPIVPVIGAVAAAPLPQPNQMHPAHLAPTTVRAVEQAYFKQHQYMQQQMRPLAEVIGARNFYFLQESELDSPDMMQHQQQQHQQSVYPPQQLQQQQSQQSSQMSPTQQHQQAQIIHQQTMQQMSPAPPQQQQLPSQAFPNPAFPSMVSSPMFNALKPSDLPQQPHIPGFASPNAPIPIPIVQPAIPPQQQLPQGAPLAAGGNIQATAPIAAFPTAGKFVAPHQQPTNQSKQQHMQPATKEVRGVHQQQPKPHHQSILPTETKALEVAEQRVPEITEWKPEDANKTAEEITEWRDPYPIPQEVTDWNDETPEESNTWSNSSNSQRFPYRNHQGGNGNYNGRNRGSSSRSGGGADNRNGGSENRSSAGTSSGTTTNGYRNNRSNNSYPQNGRQSGGSGGNSAGGGNVGSNPNTFYRNNDSYYQNGNNNSGGYRGSAAAGGSGDSNKDNNSTAGYNRGGDNRGDNNAKSDYRNVHFRSRDIREANRGQAAGGPQSRNNRYNSDSAERGTSAANSNNQSSASSNNNNGARVAAATTNTTTNSASSRNGPVSTGQQNNVRPAAATKQGGGNAYGGGPRPSGNTRPQQGVNV